MKRRDLLKHVASAGALGLTGPLIKVEAQVAKATRGMRSPKIKDISVIECEPAGVRLTVVKITTDQDGLYGYGCGTFTQRADLVKPAVEKYLKPFLLGKPTDRIEDTWQSCYDSSYWKNGPVLNNAISGIDQALWDIKGRQAGMPVYQLLGGKCREAVDTYGHAGGADYPDVVTSAKHYIEQGFRNVRIQVGIPGMAGYASSGGGRGTYKPLHDKPFFEPVQQYRRSLKLFEVCRKELGSEVGLLHDVHERLTPNEAVRFCKEVGVFDPFFIEDPLSPEDLDYFRQIRANCATPLAMGELFNSPHEWRPLIEGQLIDYIRCHLSQVGGLTPARKIALLAENYGVKTAWHGPGDVSPVGHMAQITLDIVSTNFGIQEYTPFDERTRQIFHGCPEMKMGYLWVNEGPGWGIEVNEQEAAKSPFTPGRLNLNGGWGEIRLLDGTVVKQ
jgi:mannonate dehydratase